MGILIVTPEYNGSTSAIIKNAFDWLSRTYTDKNDLTPLANKKIGVASASYLTQNQITDAVEMGGYVKSNYYPTPFYISLRDQGFNMEDGMLVDTEEIDRLAFWYQGFTHFVLSGEDHPEPLPRFIFGK